MMPAGPAALGAFICASVGFSLAAEWRRRARLRQGAELRQVAVLMDTLNSCPEGVVATDAAGRITFVNQAAARLLQVAPHDAQGASLQSIFEAASNGRRLVGNLINCALRGESRTDVTITLRPGDAREALIELSGAPIRSADGTMSGAVITFRDCTQRKRAEQ